MPDCIFCKIAQKEVKSEIVQESQDIVAFRDINPQAPTHIVVIPRKHIETVNDLTDADASLVGKMVLVARDLAKKEGHADKGYRLNLNCGRGAGQSVWHLHLHLLGGRGFSWPPG